MILRFARCLPGVASFLWALARGKIAVGPAYPAPQATYAGPDVAEELQHLRAQVERLARERDAAKAEAAAERGETGGHLLALATRDLVALRRQRDEARGALAAARGVLALMDGEVPGRLVEQIDRALAAARGA